MKELTLSQDRKFALASIFILGVAAGIPIVLILSTLSIWLKELGISKTAIGLFSLATITLYLKISLVAFYRWY